MDKKHYEQIYVDAVKREFDALKDEFNNKNDAWDAAYISVAETATPEEVAGYYIVNYKDDALEMWLDNTKNMMLDDDGKEVQRILYRLYI